jgi:hypothetical protein
VDLRYTVPFLLRQELLAEQIKFEEIKRKKEEEEQRVLEEQRRRLIEVSHILSTLYKVLEYRIRLQGGL